MSETIGRNTDEMIDDGLVDKVATAYTKVFKWAYCSTWDMLDTIPNDYRIGMLCHTIDDLTVDEVETIVNRIANDLGLDAPIEVMRDDYMDDQIGWIQPINYVSHLDSKWSRFIFHDDKETEVIPVKPPLRYKVDDILLVDFPISDEKIDCFVVAIDEKNHAYQVEVNDDSCKQLMIVESQVISKTGVMQWRQITDDERKNNSLNIDS